MRGLLTLLVLAVAALPAAAQDKVEVVTTIPDLSDLVRQVGGDRVKVTQLVAPGSDPHAVIAKASMLLKVSRADALICMGLDFEHAFMPAVLQKVRKKHLKPGGKGYMEVGPRIEALEVPESMDRLQAVDIHPRGNPHFNMDPENGRLMAAAVRDLLVVVDPDHAEEYQERFLAWDEEAQRRIADWTARMEPLRGQAIATYHRSWSYFADRYGLTLAGEVEPKPGLAPTASHLVQLKKDLDAAGVRALLMEPWYPERNVRKLVDERVSLLAFPTTIGLTEDAMTYLDFHEALVAAMLAAHDIEDPGPAPAAPEEPGT